MKKKILNVALLSVIACGAPATFTSCDDDGWKDRTNVLDEEMAENSKLIEQLTSQTKALENQIAQYKQEGDAAAKAADAAKAAADAAQKTGDDAMAAAKAADAAAQLAAKAAADAKAEAADALKKQYDELIALIKANAKEIESNSGKINDNANAIAKILETIDGSSKTFKDLQGTVAGLQVAIEALNGKAESLGLDVANLKKTMDEELGKLEANLLAEIKKNNETDAALQSEINAIKAELEKLGIATNLAEFTKFIGDANTQFDALKKYDEELTTKLADLASKVSAADALIKANQDSIESQKKALDEVNALAAKNATAILENTNKIAANAKDIEALKGEVTNVKNSIDSVNAQVKAIDAKIDSISKNIMGVQANLVTFVMEQLRGLVFVPETFVDGMECALAYNMSYYKMMQGEKGTGNTTSALLGDFSGYINTADYNRFNYIAVNDDSSKADKDKFGDNDTPQTWVSYNMNPATATVKQEDLHIISHNATVISRASKAGLEIEGMELADGVLKVAIKGNAKESEMSSEAGEVPVFAIQADVYYDAVGEDGETVKNKTVVTSDYAIFQTMFVKNPKLVAESDTEVELKGKKNLNELVAIQYKDANDGDAQWENGAWSKFVKVEFEAVKYAESAPEDGGVIKNSQSDYVTINGNMLTVNTDNPQAINAEPLIRAAMYDLKGNLIGQNFFTITITNNVKNIPVAKIAFKNMDFSYCGDRENEMPEGVNLYKAVLEASGLGEAEFLATYEADAVDDVMQQYVFKNNAYESVESGKEVGKVEYCYNSLSYNAPYSLKWTFTQEQQQQLYAKKNRAAETYVCFKSSDESKYAPIYVPLSIAMNNKTQLTISGGKYDALWSGANAVTIHANAESETGFATLIGFDLCKLWTNKVPSFNDQNGKAFDLKSNKAAVKYYFPKTDDKEYTTFEAEFKDLKHVLTVNYSSQKNNALHGGSANFNSNMGDNALLADEANVKQEYQNRTLSAKLVTTYKGQSTPADVVEIPEFIKIIKSEDGDVDYITIADNANARSVINLFGKENKQIKALVAMVPYHNEDNCAKIAYALTNPTFDANFLRPINIATVDGLEFTNGSINIFDLLTFEDWQGAKFSANPWLYGRYNVKKVEVNTTNIMTNAADGVNFRTDANVLFEQVAGNDVKFDAKGNASAGDALSDAIDYTSVGVSKENGAKLQAKAKFGFGSIKLVERGAISKAFDVYVPLKVTYSFGTYTVFVKCKVAAVSAN